MQQNPEEALSEGQLPAGLRNIIKDGVASQAMGVLTGGAFLVAFAVKLGASSFLIGLIASIGPLSQLLQIPSIILVEKIRKRRLIVVLAASSSRLCWLLIALIPFLFTGRLALSVLFFAMIVASAFGAVSGCSWNSWMRDLIPSSILGSFFSKRMRIATGVGIAVSILAAGYLDISKKIFPAYELQAYSILFIVGFLAGGMGIFFLAMTPEVNMPKPEKRLSIFRLLAGPFKNENFRKLIAFMSAWNFAVNLAAPFFMVYMLKRLQMSMSFIIALSILSQVMNFAFLKLWGKYTDRFSNKSVLAVCGPLFIISILAWTFTTMPEKYFLTIPLLICIHIVMGISSAGIALASGNITLKLAPSGEATSYLATNTIVNSVAAGIAPIIGGKFVDFFGQRKLELMLNYTSASEQLQLPAFSLTQWDFFFAIAFIIGIYALHRLFMVKEAGEVEEKIVITELVQEARMQVRTLSSVEGLRQMVTFPFAQIKYYVQKAGLNGKIDKDH